MDMNKLSDIEIRDPRLLGAYVAGQIMCKVLMTVYSHGLGDKYFTVHNQYMVYNGRKKLGEYIIDVICDNNDNTCHKAHTFDIQMLLDLRDDWAQYVENKTLSLMEDVYKETIDGKREHHD